MKPLALVGARIFDGESFLDGHAVLIEDGKIAEIAPTEKIRSGAKMERLAGGMLAPGFIDVQVNGGGGALLNGDPTPACVRRIAQSHRRFGTTGLLPTVITDAPEVTRKAIAAVAEARRDTPGILGIHVEGPFLEPARKGAHPPQYIRQIARDDLEWITAASACGAVMVTLAPNRVSPEFVRELVSRGVRVSLGHSDATMAQALVALDAGATAFTHLFNAMSQLTGREPGMVGAALSHGKSYVGMIADGHHVHADSLRLALRAKDHSRFMLVTDAMPTAAGGPDRFLLQGRETTRRDGRLQLADGTLAGSDLTMDAAVRFAVGPLGVPLAEALRMASANPAAFLGRAGDLGRIAPGYIASLVHLNEKLEVAKTWIDGK